MPSVLGNTVLSDLISKPGDPLVSSDGDTSVTANNDGTATISHTTHPSGLTPPLVAFDNFSGYTGSVQMKGPFSTQDGWRGYVEDSCPDPTDMYGFMSGWALVAPDEYFYDKPMLWHDSTEVEIMIYDIDTVTPVAKDYQEHTVSSVTVTRSNLPPVTTTERVLTESDIGDINAVLDAINGEVV